MARDWIGLRSVGKRENIGGIKKRRGRLRVARRLREAMVEAAHARAGHVHKHPVDRPLPGFVRIESFKEKMPEKSPALRNACRINALRRSQLVLLLFQIR